MALHIFGTILTPRGVSHNNRGENEGTVSTLQKIIRHGELYSTISGEAIRYALRELWTADHEKQINRSVSHDGSAWKDVTFKDWGKYMDNDVLGFMHPSKDTDSRRGILEIGRAVSTTPWPGTVSNHFAAVGSQPRMNENPIPYAAEIHDTRYQYTFAMTPGALAGDDVRVKMDRTKKTLEGLRDLRRVGGAHARFLFDFGPECIILRLTHDPAPRIMFCFEEDDERNIISLRKLADRMRGERDEDRDVRPDEIIVGGLPTDSPALADVQGYGVTIKSGVKAAFNELIDRLNQRSKELK